MRYPAYTKYKPSGIEWLGEVPEHWELRKVTHCFSKIGSGTTPKTDAGDYYDGDIPWVTTSELREGIIRETRRSVTYSAVADYPSLRMYEPGTVLIAMYGATIGRLAILGTQATVNQACCAFAGPKFVESDFLFYWLWMRRPVLISLAAGGGQPNLSQDDLRQLRIPAPPPTEQSTIIDFLDAKTRNLDTLLGKKKLLIEKLKEKRAALISQTVTRGLPPEAARAAGLDPHPKLKPSGIDWIGNIPEHWNAGNLRRFAKMKTGHTPSRQEPEYWEDCKIPWFTLADVWQLRDGTRTYLGETKELISELGLTNSAAELLPAGTVILSRTASIGFSGIMPVPMATSQDFWNWVCGPKLVPEYLLFAFRAMRPEFERLMVGSTHRTIYQGDAAGLCICVPPVVEQRAIAAYLDTETGKIDRLIATIESAIDRLQEYRTALVTAAVTGKIDVRNAAA